MKNFLPEQYKKNNLLKINHNYLREQFSDYQVIFKELEKVIIDGDFTLGEEVDKLEDEFSELHHTSNSIAVGSGTDAIMLSLKACGIEKGDEVITTPFTFFATIGAIVTAGGKPVFVDVDEDMNINPEKIEEKITKETKAIVPVHWTGRPCDMTKIDEIAERNGLSVVCDACHAINAKYKEKTAGELGDLACFSFHPLKNLNIWGDGGIITTNDENLANKIRLLRNHGLVDRNKCELFGYNSRLDTIQAVVARHMMNKIDHITQSRISNSNYLDKELRNVDEITIPKRDCSIKEVFHLYMITCEKRDLLQKYLISRDIDAKIHYPIPMHLQPAAKSLGYKLGDFPRTENFAKTIISLPVHEFIGKEELDKIIREVKTFYKKN